MSHHTVGVPFPTFLPVLYSSKVSTRAADALYVSQPTISTSIRDLEKEFHLKLFNHGKNRISLTKDGEAFYQKAEFILRQTQELYTDFSNIEKNVTRCESVFLL